MMMGSGAPQTLTTERIARALADGDVVVHYQPCYDLRTGEMVAVEALARLIDAETGQLIEPAAFLGPLEESGLIVHLDEMVLAAAAHQVAEWRGLPEGQRLCLAVNLSTADLDDPTLPERIRDAALTAGLPLDAVILELTETLLSHTGRGHEQVLADLSALGCNVTLDDFGTGNASFDYLRRFRVDGVKVDRSFVQFLGSGGPHERMAESLVRFCLSLGGHVIAEGIERPSQVEALRRLGCPFGQGFLMSRPVGATRLGELLRSGEAPGLAHPGTTDPVQALEVTPAQRRAAAVDGVLPRVLAGLVIVVLLLAGFLAARGHAATHASLTSAAEDRIAAIDSLAAHGVDLRLRAMRQAVTAASRRASVRTALTQGDAADMERALGDLAASTDGSFLTALLDAEGTMLATVPPQHPSAIGLNLADRAWFPEATASRNAVVSPAYRLGSTPERTWAIAMVAAVRGADRGVVGYLGASLALADLQDEVQLLFRRHGVTVTLIDRHGTILADSAGRIGESSDDVRLTEGAGSGGDGEDTPLWSVSEVPSIGGRLLVAQSGDAGSSDAADENDPLFIGLVVGGGVVLVILWLLSDIRRRRLKVELRRSNAWLTSVVSATPTPLLVSDDGDRIQHANAAAAALFGLDADELRGHAVGSWLSTRDQPGASGGAFPATIVTRSLGVRVVEVQVRDLAGPGGEPMRLHALVDVTPHRQEQERLRAQGRLDPLTGLANRIELHDALAAVVAPGRPPHAVVMMDLDGFKAVNDELGHAAGDTVLCAVADVLTDAVQPGDTVARVGGDEFVMVVAIDGRSDAETVAERLRSQVQQALDTHPFALTVGVSVGAVTVGTDGGDIDDLLRLVDVRMYEAKRHRDPRAR